MNENIYAIEHKAFGTDDLIDTHSYVKANSEKEAEKIFNNIAKKKRKYPDM